jgi:hypothetical protein
MAISAKDECGQPGHYLAIRLAIQWGVFEALSDVGDKGKTSVQLAEGAGADVRLVGTYAFIANVMGRPRNRHQREFESGSYSDTMG